MPKSRYKRQQAAKDDKFQSILEPYSPNFIQPRPRMRVEITETCKHDVFCPFCLHKAKINDFLISSKKGYDKRLGQCKQCSNKMLLATLTKTWTPETFADFMYEYSCQGGWQKVKFTTFNDRLKAWGWAIPFWNRYKQLKGTSDDEGYAAYMNRKGKEEVESQQLGE